jgi:hypothetical protein
MFQAGGRGIMGWRFVGSEVLRFSGIGLPLTSSFPVSPRLNLTKII